MSDSDARLPAPAAQDESPTRTAPETVSNPAPESGGVKGPEPTRYGDWEKNGRCIDF